MNRQTNWRGAAETVRRTMTIKGRQRTGLYAIEGIRLHERALRAGLTLELTLFSESFAHDNSARAQQLLANLPLITCHLLLVPNTVMAELTNGRDLGHLISLIKIPPPRTLVELVTAVPSPLLIIAADVVDPGNVGAMVRTGHANGLTAFVSVGVSDPFHPKAVRTSMGSLFKTAVCHYPTAAPLLADLRNSGIETVGTVAADGVLLSQAIFSESGTAVFMGNEYIGLSNDLIAQLNQRVSIPMADGIDSLSVNAATAVVLYEIRRQAAINS